LTAAATGVDDQLAENPAHARARVEIDAQLVRMIEVVGAHWVRIQVDAPEVQHPQKRGRVAHHDLSRRRTPTESAALLDPLRALLGGLLLENGGAIDKAFEHDGPPRNATQRALRDRRIVRMKLGVAGLPKEWLVGGS